MKPSLFLVVILAAAAAPRAAAEPGRFAAVKSLIEALPEKNPNADPSYLDIAAVTLPDQLASCRWDPAEMAAIERLVKLFDKHLGPGGDGKDALLKGIKQLPDFADMATDPEARKHYDQLAFGIRIAPDMTRAHLVNEGCRTLVKMHFGNGASRAELLAAATQSKAQLDAAPKPD